MVAPAIQDAFDFLEKENAEKRVRSQQKSIDLLMEKYRTEHDPDELRTRDKLYIELKNVLSESSVLFPLNTAQKEVYHADSGTAFIPAGLKKILLNINERFVVRPGSITDLQKFVRFAYEKRIKYTIRGAGTWPFGGSIPLNQDIILDLSNLDFFKLDTLKHQLTVGPGVIFANMRTHLRDHGFGLLQDITNTNSGTICGWVVTGGLGIGAYKYGHVKNSVQAIFLIFPNGDSKIVTPDDELFDDIFGSEGQLGIVAGVVLKAKPLSYISKPYAFSFKEAESVNKFIDLLKSWELTPSSIIYFDPHYIDYPGN